MPVLDVINVKKEKVSEIDAPDAIWDVPVTLGVLHQVVCAQLAARRQGTASTKTRSEVRGGGKKPYPAKKVREERVPELVRAPCGGEAVELWLPSRDPTSKGFLKRYGVWRCAWRSATSGEVKKCVC